MCEDARPVHKMVAVTSARPKMVASNFHREKYASLFFRSVTLHSAKEKQNFPDPNYIIQVILIYKKCY